jgi:hypothetical protein
LQDQSKNFLWQNIQLKKDLREGEDFMLVTPEIYEYAFKIYGQKGPVVVRKGIK